MKFCKTFIRVVIVLLVLVPVLHAAPNNDKDVKAVGQGWLKKNPTPLETKLVASNTNADVCKISEVVTSPPLVVELAANLQSSPRGTVELTQPRSQRHSPSDRDNYTPVLMQQRSAGRESRSFVTIPSGMGTETERDGLVQPLDFSNLTYVPNPSNYPWSATCRIESIFPWNNSEIGEFEQGTGVLIDPYHVLTAGHVVYRNWAWATNVVVYPGYQDTNFPNCGSFPFGSAHGSYLHTWPDWLTFGGSVFLSRDWDMAVITLDRPLIPAGWLGYGYNNDDSFFTQNTFDSPGYPDVDPYNGHKMYNWSGTFDSTTANLLGINTPGIGGQSGSGVYNANGPPFTVYGVYSGNEGLILNAWYTRITPSKFADIGSWISADTPSSQNLVPGYVHAAPNSVSADSQLSSMDYWILNYSTASYSGSVTVSVYLSNNDMISSELGTLLQTHTVSVNLAPNGRAHVTVATPPTIPMNTTTGTNYIGVMITGQPTDGQDASPVRILGRPVAPSNLVATTVSSNQINLSWQDDSNDEDGFRIERSSDGVNFSQIGTVNSNAPYYASTDLDSCSTYHYRVYAYNSFGNSDYSNTNNATTGGCDLTGGLVAYYPFNGNADDYVGTNNGYAVGATLTSDRFGNSDCAYYFDGTSAIQLPNQVPLQAQSSFTYALWVYNTNDVYNECWFIDRLAGDTTLSIVGLTATGPSQTGYAFNVRYDDGTTAPNWFVYFGQRKLNAWQHVAMVRDYGNALNLYLDGVLVGSGADNGKSVTAKVTRLGLNPGQNIPSLIGKIDDFRIYNHALSSTEIAQLCAGEAPLTPAILTGATLPSGTTGIPYTFTLHATYGTPAYTWSVVSNSLPLGMTLVAGTGVITGTPTVVAISTFRVRVAGSNSLYSEKDFSLTINDGDSDGDGVSNSWMLSHFGHITGSAADLSRATDDADGDGMVNLQEYVAGTNPKNASSLFGITSVTHDASGVVVAWPCIAGKTYKILYASDPTGPWQTDLPDSQVTATAGQTTLSYSDTSFGTVTKRFYKIRIVP